MFVASEKGGGYAFDCKFRKCDDKRLYVCDREFMRFFAVTTALVHVIWI